MSKITNEDTIKKLNLHLGEAMDTGYAKLHFNEISNLIELYERQQTENERLNNELHSKVEYIHELLEIIETNKKEIKRYKDLKKAENILDFFEQDAFKRSIYNTIDTIKQLENKIEELQKMAGN